MSAGIQITDEQEKEKIARLEYSLKFIRHPSHETGDVIEEMVPMRDGIKLYTVIYFPKGGGKWPLTFQRSCYPEQNSMLHWMARQMALRGYASGFQMCRGTGESDGKWQPFVNERNDGADTLAWLCRNGRIDGIGLYGLSYLGFTQWMIADIVPSQVKTMVISQAGVERYHANYSNGMFRHDVYTAWAMKNTGQSVDISIYPECCKFRPQIDLDEKVWGVHLDWYRDWISHSNFSDPFWHSGAWKDLREAPAGIHVPVCLIGGWYDHHLEGMFYAYDRLAENVKKKSRFVIGPWNHGLDNCVDAYDLPGSENAGAEAFCETLRWMDGIFKAYSSPEFGVSAYLIGEGRWMTYTNWPLRLKYMDFYLVPGIGNRCRLVAHAHVENFPESRICYDYDPERPPIEAIGAESMLAAPPEKRGSRLQPEPAFRDDLLSFLSDPLETDVAICGESLVVLNAVTSAADTAFAVKLMEVFPDGSTFNIRSGITSIGYRNDADTRIEYTSGEKVELTIRLWPITWTIHKGSRLRLDVMSTLFPEYHIHPNTTEPWALAEKTHIAHQNIHVGGENPSVLRVAIERVM
jgi:putative CocE/NonD family hydrolase